MSNNKNSKYYIYYFILAQTKIRGTILFCEQISINYIKKEVFELLI